ncbi:hypothetical protein ACFT30_10680 [Microbacterium ureisolvens]|uniref:hypothetical protein n=1 Tax=Microbacterium ureisolvens TaxID=2781186 RepID=UPI00363ACDA4
MQGRRATWLAGGIGLVGCGVVGMLRGSFLGAPGATAALSLLADLLWAAAVLLLAVGLSREGSVVARRPLGMASAAIVALWPLTHSIVNLLAGPWAPDQADAWLFWTYLSMVLPLLAGVIAAMQVARARVVPRPWNWAPLWVLVGQVVLWVLPQLIGVAAPDALMQMPGLLSALGTLGFLAGTLGLGILAIVLANRSREGTVAVYPPSTSS